MFGIRPFFLDHLEFISFTLIHFKMVSDKNVSPSGKTAKPFLLARTGLTFSKG